MDDFLSAVIIGVIGATVGFFAGVAAAGEAWRNDCDKLQRHLSDNAVYECRKVP